MERQQKEASNKTEELKECGDQTLTKNRDWKKFIQ